MNMNRDVYRQTRIVRFYDKTKAGLTIPEEICLDVVPLSYRGSILDIGIGAGRTTGPLAKQFRNYIGIDYSPELIDAARIRYPNKNLQVMDARKLDFDMQFDCVMFSFNGIDSVDYANRQIILRQIAAVIKPGGYFIYSTHNLDYSRVVDWINRRWPNEILLQRRQLLLRPWRQLMRIINRLKNFPRQTFGDVAGVAYVNDPGLNFGLINTYVDIVKEIEMLQRHGLVNVITVGNAKQSALYDSSDNWVYIVARKH